MQGNRWLHGCAAVRILRRIDADKDFVIGLLTELLRMFNGHKVISVTPYGRRRYVSLLTNYLERARGLIDEHHFWVNAQNPPDLEWLQSCVASAPDFYRTV